MLHCGGPGWQGEPVQPLSGSSFHLSPALSKELKLLRLDQDKKKDAVLTPRVNSIFVLGASAAVDLEGSNNRNRRRVTAKSLSAERKGESSTVSLVEDLTRIGKARNQLSF